jgi:hypothetical protein
VTSKVVYLLIFTVSWVMFLLTWARIFIHMLAKWNNMQNEFHYDLIGLLLFFGVIWFQLIRSKRDTYDLLFVSVALGAVSDLVQKCI